MNKLSFKKVTQFLSGYTVQYCGNIRMKTHIATFLKQNRQILLTWRLSKQASSGRHTVLYNTELKRSARLTSTGKRTHLRINHNILCLEDKMSKCKVTKQHPKLRHYGK